MKYLALSVGFFVGCASTRVEIPGPPAMAPVAPPPIPCSGTGVNPRYKALVESLDVSPVDQSEILRILDVSPAMLISARYVVSLPGGPNIDRVDVVLSTRDSEVTEHVRFKRDGSSWILIDRTPVVGDVAVGPGFSVEEARRLVGIALAAHQDALSHCGDEPRMSAAAVGTKEWAGFMDDKCPATTTAIVALRWLPDGPTEYNYWRYVCFEGETITGATNSSWIP